MFVRWAFLTSSVVRKASVASVSGDPNIEPFYNSCKTSTHPHRSYVCEFRLFKDTPVRFIFEDVQLGYFSVYDRPMLGALALKRIQPRVSRKVPAERLSNYSDIVWESTTMTHNRIMRTTYWPSWNYIDRLKSKIIESILSLEKWRKYNTTDSTTQSSVIYPQAHILYAKALSIGLYYILEYKENFWIRQARHGQCYIKRNL